MQTSRAPNNNSDSCQMHCSSVTRISVNQPFCNPLSNLSENVSHPWPDLDETMASSPADIRGLLRIPAPDKVVRRCGVGGQSAHKSRCLPTGAEEERPVRTLQSRVRAAPHSQSSSKEAPVISHSCPGHEKSFTDRGAGASCLMAKTLNAEGTLLHLQEPDAQGESFDPEVPQIALPAIPETTESHPAHSNQKTLHESSEKPTANLRTHLRFF